MNLRCRPGDIAMITWDHEGCLENLGRLVEVGDHLSVYDGRWVWRIRPVTPELYALIELDDTVVRETVTWASCVQHPDTWMVPIRPEPAQRASRKARTSGRRSRQARSLCPVPE